MDVSPPIAAMAKMAASSEEAVAKLRGIPNAGTRRGGGGAVGDVALSAS